MKRWKKFFRSKIACFVTHKFPVWQKTAPSTVSGQCLKINLHIKQMKVFCGLQHHHLNISGMTPVHHLLLCDLDIALYSQRVACYLHSLADN